MTRRSVIIFLIPIIWVGFAFRIHQLGDVPLRGDEAFSAQYWSDLPLSVSLGEIAPLDPHPPLVYVLFRFWGVALGSIDSPTALRLLDVLGNILGIPAMVVLGRRLSASSGVGVVAGLLWATHAYEIWHSQDFRNYAIWAGIGATTLAMGTWLIDRPQRGKWIVYGILATASAFLFYFELFLIAATAAIATLWKRWDRPFLVRILGLQAVIIAAVLLAFLLLQFTRIASGAYPGNVQPFFALDYFTRFIPTLAVGDTLAPDVHSLWLVICGALIALALVVARRSRRQIHFIGAVLLIPLVLIGLLSQRLNIFHPRYILACVPALILLIALGSHHVAMLLSRGSMRRYQLVFVVLLLPWFALHGMALDGYFNNPAFRKSPAWDELGAFLFERVSPDDLVIQLSADAAFGYYYRGAAEEIALPADPGQSPEEIIAALERAHDQYSSIYVVSNANPDWANATVVESWMRAQMQPVLQTDASGLAIRQFKSWEVSGEPGTARAQFGDIVELVDMRFFEKPLPTGELLLWVYWRSLARSDQPLKSFVHVNGEMNPASGTELWSQYDQYPQHGRLDSTSWPLATVFRDVYYLSTAALATGEYQLNIGWYDPDRGARLTTVEGQDSYTLQSFSFP